MPKKRVNRGKGAERRYTLEEMTSAVVECEFQIRRRLNEIAVMLFDVVECDEASSVLSTRLPAELYNQLTPVLKNRLNLWVSVLIDVACQVSDLGQDGIVAAHRLAELRLALKEFRDSAPQPVAASDPKSAVAVAQGGGSVGSRLLTTDAVAERIGIAPKTLKKWRCLRIGPPAIKVGSAVRYDVEELEAWLAERRRVGGPTGG